MDRKFHPEMPYVPSMNVEKLKLVVGREIENITRFALNVDDLTRNENGYIEDENFSEMYSETVISLSGGEAILISHSDSIGSVLLFFYDSYEDAVKGKFKEEEALSARDPAVASPFWKSVLGKSITALSVLKLTEHDTFPPETTRPHESAIVFYISGGGGFAVSYDLFEFPRWDIVVNIDELKGMANINEYALV